MTSKKTRLVLLANKFLTDPNKVLLNKFLFQIIAAFPSAFKE